jgi:hypothetical protein
MVGEILLQNSVLQLLNRFAVLFCDSSLHSRKSAVYQISSLTLFLA